MVKKIIPKKTRMTAILKKLPQGDFGSAELEKTIRSTRVDDDDIGINNRQTTQEYVGLLVTAGMIETRREGRYRVTEAARTTGTITITVDSMLRAPLVRDLIKRALAGAEGVTIEGNK